MKNLIIAFIVLAGLIEARVFAQERIKFYGPDLCVTPFYYCHKVRGGESWKRLFPNEEHRNIVQKVNRTYNHLWRGKVIAIPKNLDKLSILDVSPFPLTMNTQNEKKVIVDQDKLAWGAYDRDGKLVKWGPISSGKDYCPDIKRRCRTVTGIFHVFDKRNSKCRSRMFAANMPFCMFFYKGFALHGSHDIPGKRASHGCVRMFKRDAMWLNHNFVEISGPHNHYKGTTVVIRKLSEPNKVKTRKSRRQRYSSQQYRYR